MAWWHRTSKPEDEIQDPTDSGRKTYTVPADALVGLYICPDTIIPCDDPQKVVIVPRDPEPDLSTKPEDVVGYCFGYACPKKHVFDTFENISVDGFKTRKVCQKCGGVGKPATVKRTAEARWVVINAENNFLRQAYNQESKPDIWGWAQYRSYPSGPVAWTKHEFVHYLESPKRRKK